MVSRTSKIDTTERQFDTSPVSQEMQHPEHQQLPCFVASFTGTSLTHHTQPIVEGLVGGALKPGRLNSGFPAACSRWCGQGGYFVVFCCRREFVQVAAAVWVLNMAIPFAGRAAGVAGAAACTKTCFIVLCGLRFVLCSLRWSRESPNNLGND